VIINTIICCLSPLKFVSHIQPEAKCNVYNLMWAPIPVRRVYSIQHYVIEFVNDLRQVSCFHRALRFPPPLKLTPRYNWNIIESVTKHHNPHPHIQPEAKCNGYNLMWSSLSMTYDRLAILPTYKTNNHHLIKILLAVVFNTNKAIP
jgi:hypothetical protein